MDNRADAFHQLVLAHIGLIRRIGASKLRTRRDLDDYVQSVLVAVYTSRGRVRYTDHLERWIAGVARNVAREWNRKREPIFTAELPEIPFPAPPADEVLSDRERWENVVAALAKLSPQEQELLRAYYLEERTSQELGSRLGVSQGAVYVRLTRARRSLRRKLGFVFGLATWVFARPKARAFGEIPLGNGRMSTAFSLMTSTLIVGWLGVSAGHVEQVAEDVATISAGGALPIRVVQLARAEGTPRPKVTPIVSHAARKEEQGMSKVLDIGLHEFMETGATLEATR
jgi:RNA polymerase sigma-70 factor (ECF subfamily)